MPTIQLSPDQIRWQRFQRSGLAKPFADATTAASSLFGIQAQILPAAGLSLWNRTPALNHAQFESMLQNERTLVKLWGQRGTLHLYTSTDWPLLHGARTINSSWWQHHATAEQEQGKQPRIDHRRVIEEIAELLRNRETMGRRDLRASGLELNADMLSPWGGIFSELVRLGYACHYGRSEGEGRFVARERWLPDLVWEPPDGLTANLTLAQRFIAAYGPATMRDFAYWRGVGIGPASEWFKQLTSEMTEVEVDGQTAFLPNSDIDAALQPAPAPEAWPVRMLYRFDPYLLAHRNKDWVVPPAHYKAVWRPAGHIEGIVLVRGQGAATWRYDRKGNGLIITVNRFKPLPNYVTKQVEKRANQIAAFFNLPLNDLIIQDITSQGA